MTASANVWNTLEADPVYRQLCASLVVTMHRIHKMVARAGLDLPFDQFARALLEFGTRGLEYERTLEKRKAVVDLSKLRPPAKLDHFDSLQLTITIQNADHIRQLAATMFGEATKETLAMTLRVCTEQGLAAMAKKVGVD